MRVQDWNTGDKTRLNGQPIDEAVLHEGDALEIGDNRIVVAISPMSTNTEENLQPAETTAGPESPISDLESVDEFEESDSSNTASKESAFVYELDLDATDESRRSSRGLRHLFLQMHIRAGQALSLSPQQMMKSSGSEWKSNNFELNLPSAMLLSKHNAI